MKKQRKKRAIHFNGIKRESTAKARERVLKVARKRGSITHAQARIIGRWEQAWYHLDQMRKAGLLKREGFNIWRPR